ncbi:hypothetical protein [Micromonospora wenchangensis]|uniref:hypothetical protein n=1 Tax=Micromonospora wenchangensis TaxID=1185415 RepID=UPI003D763E21
MVLLVIPLITAHFASRLVGDDDAFEHVEQEELKNDVRRMRALPEELAARGRASRCRSCHRRRPHRTTRPSSGSGHADAATATDPPPGPAVAGQRAGQRSPSRGTVSEIR